MTALQIDLILCNEGDFFFPRFELNAFYFSLSAKEECCSEDDDDSRFVSRGSNVEDDEEEENSLLVVDDDKNEGMVMSPMNLVHRLDDCVGAFSSVAVSGTLLLIFRAEK